MESVNEEQVEDDHIEGEPGKAADACGSVLRLWSACPAPPLLVNVPAPSLARCLGRPQPFGRENPAVDA